MRTRKVLTMLTVFVTAVVVVEGQQRPLSPRGQSSTQVGGAYNAIAVEIGWARNSYHNNREVEKGLAERDEVYDVRIAEICISVQDVLPRLEHAGLFNDLGVGPAGAHQGVFEDHLVS